VLSSFSFVLEPATLSWVYRVCALFVFEPVGLWHALMGWGLYDASIVVVLCVHMAELSKDYSLLSWNVRGLNNQEKREDVWQMIQLHKPMIVCLHETKLHNVSASIVSQC
jgi:hypothetical protein